MPKFELEPYHRNIPSEKLIADLKRVASQIGKNYVTGTEYNKHGKYEKCTLIRKFGSWPGALEKANLSFRRCYRSNKKYSVGISIIELLNDLQRVATRLEKDSVTVVEYKIHGNFAINALLSKFGSWFNALEKAGLKKTRNLHITKEEYFKNIEEVWIKLGRQPRYAEMHKPLSKYSAHGYEYIFGTWRKALEQFIKYINKEEIPQVDKEPIVEDKESYIKNESVIKHKTKRQISDRLRFIIMKRDNFRCQQCGRSPATDPTIILHIDHKTAYTNGGETIPENLQTLCSKCNIGKSNL